MRIVLMTGVAAVHRVLQALGILVEVTAVWAHDRHDTP
jgi:hypothetical protein